MDDSIKNIYPDEQEKISNDAKEILELSLKMKALLDDYGYAMEPTLVDGLPDIRFVKV